MRSRGGAVLATGLVLALALTGFLLVPPAEIPAAAAPSASSFDPGLVARGADLARLGFCASCHTAERGQPYAGGRPLETGFGLVFGTNITPDEATGIGRWSLAAFTRAMRQGVDRTGARLYPAFPYTHFTKLADADVEALYAYVMTRDPVRADTPANRLRFPFNIRPLLAAWNLLFFRDGRYVPDAGQGTDWNRGAYLAEALSHCGACHSPRNALGAEEASRAYDGGAAEGWWAPPIDAASVAPAPWSTEGLFNYLRSWDVDHGGAAGPMAPVVNAYAQASPAEARAVATYIVSLAGPPSNERLHAADAAIAHAEAYRADRTTDAGATLYAGACATCHDSGGAVPFTLRSLALHSAVHGDDPSNVVEAVLRGIAPPNETVGGYMPPFADVLSDAQVGDLLAYLRVRFAGAPPWRSVEAALRRVRGAD